MMTHVVLCYAVISLTSSTNGIRALVDV